LSDVDWADDRAPLRKKARKNRRIA